MSREQTTGRVTSDDVQIFPQVVDRGWAAADRRRDGPALVAADPDPAQGRDDADDCRYHCRHGAFAARVFHLAQASDADLPANLGMADTIHRDAATLHGPLVRRSEGARDAPPGAGRSTRLAMELRDGNAGRRRR